MPAIVTARLDGCAPASFLAPRGVGLAEPVISRALICGEDRPLLMWLHELDAGASVVFDQPDLPQSIYVLAGSVVADDVDLPAGSAVLVEPRGRVMLRASASGTRLLHVFRPALHADVPRRDGGHVHRVGPEGIYRSREAHPFVMFADSTCPHCEIWLHRTAFGPNRQGGAHRHDVDEIIFVLQGSAVIGRQDLPVGAAIAVDANTAYRLNSGAQGLVALNFRMNDPSYTPLPRDGSPLRVVRDLDVIRERLRLAQRERGA